MEKKSTINHALFCFACNLDSLKRSILSVAKASTVGASRESSTFLNINILFIYNVMMLFQRNYIAKVLRCCSLRLILALVCSSLSYIRFEHVLRDKLYQVQSKSALLRLESTS